MLLRDLFVLNFAGDDRNLVVSYGPCQVLYCYQFHLVENISSSCCTEILYPRSNILCSFLLLVLLWKDIGKYNHMKLKNFGPSTVLILQMRELQNSAGCNIVQFLDLYTYLCFLKIYLFCIGVDTCLTIWVLLYYMKCVLKNQLQLWDSNCVVWPTWHQGFFSMRCNYVPNSFSGQ